MTTGANVPTIQKVFFDGQMREVSQVAGVLLESGKSPDYIFRKIGFLLGFMTFEESANTTETTGARCVPDTSRYPCTFPCIIERYTRPARA
jgi:hypothetical protein